jgi:hypothetical protein
VTVCLYIIFWAAKIPLPDATTDLGDIPSLISNFLRRYDFDCPNDNCEKSSKTKTLR